MRDLLLFVALVTLVASPPPPPPPRPPDDIAPPPPPPADIAPISPQQLSKLARKIQSPPPSPPYGATPAGQKEEGRGVLIQQQLKQFISEHIVTLRSDDMVAARAALSEISLLALETTISESPRTSWLSGVHPVAFRKACCANTARSAGGEGSLVEAIVALLSKNRCSHKSDGDKIDTCALALQSLEAIATDDPSTDQDNDHALAICATGVVPRIVPMLSSKSESLHGRAAATTAALVENAHCAKMFTGFLAIHPLLTLGRDGADWVRAHALAALRMLAIDRDAREKIASAGGKDLLEAITRFGPKSLRKAAAEFASTLDAKQSVSIDATAHAKQARATRVAQSKLRNSQVLNGPQAG